jgi:hypothetical protein
MGSFVLYAKTRSPHDNNAKATRLKDEGLGPSFLEINAVDLRGTARYIILA